MVDVYERSPVALTGRGAGIMTHPELRAALAELGLDTGRDFGVAVEGRLVLDIDGRRDRRGTPARRSPPPGTGCSRC